MDAVPLAARRLERILRLLVISSAAAGAAASGAALAEESGFVIVVPCEETLARKAPKFVADWTAYLRERLKWPEGTLSGTYFNDVEDALLHLDASPPAYGVVGIDFYLAYRDRYGMRRLLVSQPWGAAAEKFVVVTREEGGPAKLEELGGAKIVGRCAQIPAFVTGLVLDGANIPGGAPTLAFEKRSLQAVRSVARQEADAAILAAGQWETLKQTEEFSRLKLRVIHTSDPVPNPIFVAFGDAPADEIVRVLKSMGEDERGREFLFTMHESGGFSNVDEAAFGEAERAFDAAAGRRAKSDGVEHGGAKGDAGEGGR